MQGAVLFAALFSASALNGTVIFTNYNLSDPSPFNQPSFAVGQVGDPAQGPVHNYQWSTPFSITDAYRLETITLALAAFAPGPAVTVEFYGPDSVSGIPGPLLESWTIPGLPAWNPAVTAAGVSLTFASTVRPLLVPGQLYWVSASAPNSPQPYLYAWFDYPNQTCCSLVAERVDFAPQWATAFSTAATLQVTGTSVPEPSTTGLVALLFAAALGRHLPSRSRKR